MKGASAMGSSHRRLEDSSPPAPGTSTLPPRPSRFWPPWSTSGKRYVQGGLLESAKALKMTPYQVLIVGSLVQKEAKPADFAKVARVIYNRLASEYDRLEFDSTVNYPLDRQEVATTDADRATETRGTPTPRRVCRPPRSARPVRRPWRRPSAQSPATGCTS